MDIRQLEDAVKLVTEENPAQSALQSLASGSQSLIEMPDEFVKAVETLTSRAADVVQQGMLKDISAKWK